MDIHRSARRHGVADDEMFHALAHSIVVEDIGEDPDPWLLIGPNRSGNLLEIVVLQTSEGTQMIIHAMRLRPAYQHLLER